VSPYLRVDIKHHLDTFVADDPEALLFPAARAVGGVCHLSQNVFREAFQAACKSAGRDGVNVHALSHLGATLAARAGATLAEVQARLGHSTVGAAMAHQHSEASRQADLAVALSANDASLLNTAQDQLIAPLIFGASIMPLSTPHMVAMVR
jgi:integrase